MYSTTMAIFSDTTLGVHAIRDYMKFLSKGDPSVSFYQCLLPAYKDFFVLSVFLH